MPRHPALHAALACAIAACALTASADDAMVPGEIVVRFHDIPTQAAIDAIDASIGIDTEWRALRHAPHAKGQPGTPHPGSYWRVLSVPADTDLDVLSSQLTALLTVKLAAPNARPEPTLIPSDPFFGQQWAPTKIDAPDAWDITTGDPSIIIGSIDTGTRVTHEDLQGRLWVNDDPPNGIDDDGNGFIDDSTGWDFVNNDASVEDVWSHGTQVAGIMSANLDNGLGMSGLGNFTVMTGKWWHFSGSDATVGESVFYAVDNGARVLNLSLGCQCLMPLSEDAINYAHANGVVSFCAAGNAGTQQPGYPAAYPNAISVSAVDINDNKPGFSNSGPTVDVAAPSPNILSTGASSDSSYPGNFGGTSAASPHAAGVGALMLAANPNLTPEEIRQILRDTADDLGAPGFDNTYAWGRVNAGAAVAAAAAASCDADFNGDGSLNALDFVAFQAAFVAGDASADCNGDFGFSVLDFICFQAAFSAGCP